MENNEMTYFTHAVGGKLYGGWCRVLSAHRLEVLAVGMLETVGFAGFDPESTARSVLEEFVRRRASNGGPMPVVPDSAGSQATQHMPVTNAAQATIRA